MSDRELKDQGNKLYLAKRYEDAIACYTKAIQKNGSVPQYYTNRALCLLKLARWSSATRDCKAALAIDHTWVKGHFFLGQALMELECYEEAIVQLHMAHDLATTQKMNFGDDITSQLRLAKKKHFAQQESKRIKEESDLQIYLERLIREDRDKQIEKLSHSSDLNEAGNEISKVEVNAAQYLVLLDDIFTQIDDKRKKREVPDYLCGKISFEILKDPVITPSGITYDRKDIEEHLQRVGHFDPVTRVKLTKEQLIPNFSMKEVVDNYLSENEWALHY
uniref:E3 ubiquitin-protein ligase CHIP n=1 Tax=Evadne anonyx TaxID=141404 RepID=A0A9N6WXL1_9CRUS|nr:EOG090X0AJZ [Evadne anonyx]